MKRADRVLLKVVAVASVAVVGVAVSQQGADPEDPPDEAAEVYAKPPDCGPLPARDGPKSYHDAYLEDVIERNRRKGLCPEVADEAPAVPAEEPEAPTPLRPTLVSDDGDVWAYGSVEVAAAYEMAFDQIAELRAAEPTLFGGDRARAKREVDRAAFALMAALGDRHFGDAAVVPTTARLRGADCFDAPDYPGRVCEVTLDGGGGFRAGARVFVDSESVRL